MSENEVGLRIETQRDDTETGQTFNKAGIEMDTIPSYRVTTVRIPLTHDKEGLSCPERLKTAEISSKQFGLVESQLLGLKDLRLAIDPRHTHCPTTTQLPNGYKSAGAKPTELGG